MAIERFGVKTQSGSWYYIEDHTHLIGSPTWKLITKDDEFFILGLLDERQNRILASNITRTRQLLGHQIFYGPRGLAELFANSSLDFLGGNIPHTSPVVEIIEFR